MDMLTEVYYTFCDILCRDTTETATEVTVLQRIALKTLREMKNKDRFQVQAYATTRSDIFVTSQRFSVNYIDKLRTKHSLVTVNTVF